MVKLVMGRKYEDFNVDMNSYFDLIASIEKNNDLRKFCYQDVNVWNTLKMAFFNIITNDHFTHISKNKKAFSKLELITTLLKPSKFPDNVDVIAFTSTANRKCLNGAYVNIFLNWLPENGLKTLFFEMPNPNFRRQKVRNRYELVYPMEKILPAIAARSKIKIKKVKSFLEEILEGSKYTKPFMGYIDILASYVSRYLASVEVFRRFLKKVNVKTAFFVCFYSTINRAAVKVAKEYGIKTVDVQHGIITSKHAGYISPYSLIKDDVVDFVFVYGKFFKDVLINNSVWFNSDNVIVTGNYYMTKYKEIHTVQNEGKKNRKRELLITSQPAIPEEAYEDIIKESIEIGLNPVVKLHPADSRDKFKKYDIRVIDDSNVSLYDFLTKVDYHATVHSTSALEALAFGVPNIVIPWKGLYKNIDFILDDYTTKLYKKRELKGMIDTLSRIPNDVVKSKGRKFFKNWNQQIVNNFTSWFANDGDYVK
ncbi:MAG TPA: hypothetical protein ENF81_08495 [Thermotogaceae bacterium]|nr:hypothetical protein [Thermotogaceae bacterium]